MNPLLTKKRTALKEAIVDVDFADSSFKLCKFEESNLLILLNSWDNKTIELTFFNTIHFSYKLGDFIQGLYELNSSNSLEEAVLRYYSTIPARHNFRIFQILDIYDLPLFEMIAEGLEIQKKK